MLKITQNIWIGDEEIEFSAIRAQGSGGQNVNKVSSAIHLRFDVKASSLPDSYKLRLMNINDRRISKDGVVVIKAQRYRTQEKNRDDALERLQVMVKNAIRVQKMRRATKPSKASKQKRLDSKAHRAKAKSLRGKVADA